MTGWKIAAALWALAVLGSGAVLVRGLQTGLRYESELLSLLPTDATRPLVTVAIDRMAESGGRGVVLLIGDEDEARAAQAADACAARLKGAPGIGNVVSRIDAAYADQAISFYLPFRYGLLTAAQRQRLEHASDAELVQRALEGLYGPVGPPRLAPLEADPLGLFGEALLDSAARGALNPSNDRLIVRDGATTWVAVLVELAQSGASLGERDGLVRIFDEADAAARALGAKTLRAGFLFHAAVAAHQAQHEMSTIGLGSLLGIVLLVLVTFRSFQPLLLVVLPIAVGSVVALGLSQVLFEKLHLLTFVFGTSIIGVAVDYGFLFVAGRMAAGEWDAAQRRREILPAVSMALATSLLAYAVLVALPFPILRQMGVFTMLGLVGAFLTAVFWLPILGRSLPPMDGGPIPRLTRWAHARWPRASGNRAVQVGLVVAAVAATVGLARTRSDDDVHGLYAAAPDLVREQEAVERLMHLPAAGQFFLVRGASEEEVLRRDEALSERLEAMKASGEIADYVSPTTYVPSQQRQVEARALILRRIDAAGGVADRLFSRLGQPELAAQSKAEFAENEELLTPARWLASPISTPFRSLWLGTQDGAVADVVTVSGIRDAETLQALGAAASPGEGVEWVDHLRALSELLGSFRHKMVGLMILGYAVVAVLLFLRYRRQAWRVFTPTFLAVLGTAGLFGWLGLNLNLFCIFGLLLSLDMGVDYGIYVQDRRAGSPDVALLCASLSAIATLLSFGLLALSATPALRTFGLSVFLAITGSWLLAPVFTERETHDDRSRG